jgi:ribonuclease HI
MENHKMIIYTDGGARGNPGPAACGYVIDGKSYGEYLGKLTNNEAEYQGVIRGLKKAVNLLGGGAASVARVEVRMDSELLVRQFGGEYKVKAAHLKPLYAEVCGLISKFKEVAFIHIPREKNKEADRMVNEILDKYM